MDQDSGRVELGLGKRYTEVGDDHELYGQMILNISTQIGYKKHEIGRCGSNHGSFD